ncbi:MAG: DUF5058 family protein [Christensenellaceae bacterium]|jgi:hypothetical protein|nr:DUF5058 family protein [Christensenellaceae bacterium]
MPTDYVGVYILGVIIVLSIIGMATYYLIKSLKRAKAIGMSPAIIKNAIKSSAVFSVLPSIPIVIGVGVMMSYLGLAIPWIRLTVIGALQYELLAMDQVGITQAIPTPELIGTAAIIMTFSIVAGPIFNIVAYRKLQHKLVDLERNNKRLLDTITGALLGGILAGLASHIIIGAFFSGGAVAEDGITTAANGYITLITLAISMVTMAVCGILITKLKWTKLENYALPITILVAMGSAYALTFAF